VIDGARTVNGAVTTSMAPLVAVAVTVYGAADTSPTTNEPLRVPPDMLQVAPAPTGVPETVQVESLGDQPEPETVTAAPMCCGVEGLSTRVGVRGLTVKEAEPQSPAAQPEPPFTVMVYGPGDVTVTRKDPETLPLEIEHAGEAITGLGVTIVHGERSVVKNPAPVIEIVCPATPDVGFNVIVGASIVKVLEIVS